MTSPETPIGYKKMKNEYLHQRRAYGTGMFINLRKYIVYLMTSVNDQANPRRINPNLLLSGTNSRTKTRTTREKTCVTVVMTGDLTNPKRQWKISRMAPYWKIASGMAMYPYICSASNPVMNPVTKYIPSNNDHPTIIAPL